MMKSFWQVGNLFKQVEKIKICWGWGVWLMWRKSIREPFFLVDADRWTRFCAAVEGKVNPDIWSRWARYWRNNKDDLNYSGGEVDAETCFFTWDPDVEEWLLSEGRLCWTELCSPLDGLCVCFFWWRWETSFVLDQRVAGWPLLALSTPCSISSRL